MPTTRSTALLQQAYEQDIIVLNLTQCFSGKVNMDGYATATPSKSRRNQPGYDMTVEAALAKLHYLLSQDLSINEVRQQLNRNLRGEMTFKICGTCT